MKSPIKKPDPILAAVQRAASSIINNPTRAMEATFSSLSPGHQWILFAMLDCGRWLDEQELVAAYEKLCPEEHAGISDKLIAELNESFLSSEEFVGGGSIRWTHPTCKDLAVQMLAGNHADRQRFLQHCGPEGLQTAFGVGAGSTGKLNLPLLRSEKDWLIAAGRLKAESHIFSLRLLLEPLKLKPGISGFDHSALEKLAIAICLHVRDTTTGTWNNDTLNAYLMIRRRLTLKIATPGLSAHLRDLVEVFENRSWISENITDGFASFVEDLAEFCSAAASTRDIAWNYFLKSPTFTSAIFSLAHATKQYDENYSEGLSKAEEFREASDAFEKLSKSLQSLSVIVERTGHYDLWHLSQQCSQSASSLNDKASEGEDRSTDDLPDAPSEESGELSHRDIEKIFEDL